MQDLDHFSKLKESLIPFIKELDSMGVLEATEEWKEITFSMPVKKEKNGEIIFLLPIIIDSGVVMKSGDIDV